LQKVYAELLVISNKRLSDLETLQDFLQSATNELIWLNEKEEIEVSRDWSDKNLNIPAIEQYYEVRMRYPPLLSIIEVALSTCRTVHFVYICS
jgi:hypothetical protein